MIADMTGILLFIGIMQATGFLDVIVRDIVLWGNKLGGGPGVCTAGGIAAGVIGALTGFTQPVITAVITGPAAVKLGVDPNKVAGIQAHAGHIGNLAGFTHPTQVAILATAGIGYGLFNVLGLIAALSIFFMSYVRVIYDMHKRGVTVSEEDRIAVMDEIKNKEYKTTSGKAFFPFLVLLSRFHLRSADFPGRPGIRSRRHDPCPQGYEERRTDDDAGRRLNRHPVGRNDRLPVHEHGY